jgi:hypothetical protein
MVDLFESYDDARTCEGQNCKIVKKKIVLSFHVAHEWGIGHFANMGEVTN